jgi:hypothetical protein
MVNEAIAARYFPRIAQMTWTTGGGDPVTGVVAGTAS